MTDKQQLKAENEQLKKNIRTKKEKIEKIKEYCNKYPTNSIGFKKKILQIIESEE